MTLLTKDHGRLVGVAAHARKSRRRFGGGLSLGTVGEIDFVERPQSDLVRLEQIAVVHPPPDVRTPLVRFALFGLVLNLVEQMSVSHQQGQDKFALVRTVVAATEALLPQSLFLYFMVHWLALTGFAPTMTECARCGIFCGAAPLVCFASHEGGVICQTCAPQVRGALPVPSTARALWHDLLEAGAPDDVRPLSPEENAFFHTALWQYLQHVLDRPLAAAPYWPVLWESSRGIA